VPCGHCGAMRCHLAPCVATHRARKNLQAVVELSYILGLLYGRAVDSTSEKRLITMLVENYRQNGVDGRPVVNTSSALTVTISFSLIQILHFDPTQHAITVVGWISLVRCASLYRSLLTLTVTVTASSVYTQTGTRGRPSNPWNKILEGFHNFC